jgi:hypothetical protein
MKREKEKFDKTSLAILVSLRSIFEMQGGVDRREEGCVEKRRNKQQEKMEPMKSQSSNPKPKTQTAC